MTGARELPRASVALLVPIAPAPAGNGLAMRAGMLLDALAPVADVHVVVVPVSGPADVGSWARVRARSVTIVPPVVGDASREHTTRMLADPELRARVARTAPVPLLAALAPPTLASAVVAALPDTIGAPDAVLAMRLYLAPLGIWLARSFGGGRVVVDADDDDAALFESLGRREEADAFTRLARCWLPDADAVFAASAPAATGITTAAGLDRVQVVSNVVAPPATVSPPPDDDHLLFVANLTYEPNRIAARSLVSDVLPAVRSRRPAVTLALVGAHDGSLPDLARVDGVHLTGAVPDVASYYERADVVVVPLRHGSGTRIKVLEAFAHGRPVVATSTAVAGLEVVDGEHVVIADTPGAQARAVVALLTDRARAAAMAGRAAALVRSRYDPATVAPIVRSGVLGTHTQGLPGGSSAQ